MANNNPKQLTVPINGKQVRSGYHLSAPYLGKGTSLRSIHTFLMGPLWSLLAGSDVDGGKKEISCDLNTPA